MSTSESLYVEMRKMDCGVDGWPLISSEICGWEETMGDGRIVWSIEGFAHTPLESISTRKVEI